ncbi:MAG: hypothetical protein E7629_08820 [Ruminococcaceae bacterium]|nr:hypothetical protein [Oscillospiraceae bacterium]
MRSLLGNPRISIRISLLCSGLTAILQALAYALSYEGPNVNYFIPNALFPFLATILMFVAIGFGALAAFTVSPKAQALKALPCKAASIPAAVGFVAGAAILLLSNNTTPARIAVALLLVSAAYHVAVLAVPERHAAWVALIGFAPIIACVLISGIYYFDNTLEMNAPVKVSVMMGLLCATVYYTGELRILLEKPMPKTFVILSSLTVAVCSLSALPLPIGFLTGHFDRVGTLTSLPPLASTHEYPIYLAGATILLGTAVCAALRCLYLLSKASSEETE